MTPELRYAGYAWRDIDAASRRVRSQLLRRAEQLAIERKSETVTQQDAAQAIAELLPNLQGPSDGTS